MTVYFITLALVTLFCGMAYRSDYVFPYGMMCDRRVYHTPQSRIWFTLAVAALTFVGGFRYYVGTDFGAYYDVNPAWSEVWDKIITLEEPGFYFLAYLSRRISNDPVASTFIATAVTIVIALVVLYRNTDNLLIAGVFYTITSWNGCFNGVRQFLAMSFIFAGYSSLRDRKFGKYLIWVLIAFLFHRSAIVMILPYFIVKRDVNWKNIISLAVVVAIALFSYDYLFNAAGWVLDGDASYVNDTDYAKRSVNILRVLSSLLPTAFFVLSNIWKKRSDYTNFCLNLLLVDACTCLVTMNSAYLYRIAIYTGAFKLFAMPELLKLYSKDNRKVLTWLMIILFAIMWWYEISRSSSLCNFVFVWNR